MLVAPAATVRSSPCIQTSSLRRNLKTIPLEASSVVQVHSSPFWQVIAAPCSHDRPAPSPRRVNAFPKPTSTLAMIVVTSGATLGAVTFFAVAFFAGAFLAATFLVTGATGVVGATTAGSATFLAAAFFATFFAGALVAAAFLATLVADFFAGIIGVLSVGLLF